MGDQVEETQEEVEPTGTPASEDQGAGEPDQAEQEVVQETTVTETEVHQVDTTPTDEGTTKDD